jgi:23S rRNA pseudouridine1911/1915/1917 synthase
MIDRARSGESRARRPVQVQDGWEIGTADAGTRLDRFLASKGRLGSRSRARWALERGKVVVNDREASPDDGARALATGDRVRLWMDRPGSARRRTRHIVARARDLQVVYEDDALLVVNKPAGLLTVPLARRPDADSVERRLQAHLRSKAKRRALVVHRIDRDTSGLVVFAARADAQQALKAQFERREPERVYLAIVAGQPEPVVGSWRDLLVWDKDNLMQRPSRPGEMRTKECRSDYRVLEQFRGAALVEVRLVTGKRNQIRVQAALNGHPLVGERRYTGRVEVDIPFERQALHAYRLAFSHPDTGRPLRFEAGPPNDFVGLLERLRLGQGTIEGR